MSRLVNVVHLTWVPKHHMLPCPEPLEPALTSPSICALPWLGAAFAAPAKPAAAAASVYGDAWLPRPPAGLHPSFLQ